MGAFARHHRATQLLRRFERFQPLMIGVPDANAAACYLFGLLELRPQESCDDLSRQIGRADIDPSIFVDLPPEKLTSVGAFLAYHLRTCQETTIVDQQRPTFAAD